MSEPLVTYTRMPATLGFLHGRAHEDAVSASRVYDEVKQRCKEDLDAKRGDPYLMQVAMAQARVDRDAAVDFCRSKIRAI